MTIDAVGVTWSVPGALGGPIVLNLASPNSPSLRSRLGAARPYWEVGDAVLEPIGTLDLSEVSHFDGNLEVRAIDVPRTLFKVYGETSRGLVNAHAGVICRNGIGIAISGERGAGKTTLALTSVLREGFDLVANDQVMLGASCGALLGVGNPARIGVRDPQLIAHLARLGGVPVDVRYLPNLPLSQIFEVGQPSSVTRSAKSYSRIDYAIHLVRSRDRSFKIREIAPSAWLATARFPLGEAYGLSAVEFALDLLMIGQAHREDGRRLSDSGFRAFCIEQGHVDIPPHPSIRRFLDQLTGNGDPGLASFGT